MIKRDARALLALDPVASIFLRISSAWNGTYLEWRSVVGVKERDAIDARMFAPPSRCRSAILPLPPTCNVLDATLPQRGVPQPVAKHSPRTTCARALLLLLLRAWWS